MKLSNHESELILNPDGSLYHLHLQAGQVADRIFFVGDPARVDILAQHFDSISHKIRNREFYTLSGFIGKQFLSIVSTGIGTDNVDIVWNELDALFNFDLEKRQIKSDLRQLKVLRLGTCGGLQADIPTGSLVHSRFAIGADGLMHFYDTQEYSNLNFQKAMLDFQVDELPSTPAFYAAEAAESFSQLLDQSSHEIHQGITLTAAGFYGPQGRNLGRLKLRCPNLPESLSKFSFDGFPVLNLEMETAGILSLGKGLGHQAASLSVILANRSTGEFSPHPKKDVEKLLRTGIELMLEWE
ncbi:MAG: nucleoside phosphorylase [Bacteroidota bacterium]